MSGFQAPTVRALRDVPRCLDLGASFVGEPRQASPDAAPAARRWRVDADVGRIDTAVFRRQAIEECLDTAAVLRAYREPLPGETWMLPRKSEQRLLAQVNAIVALGPDALRWVAALAIDPDIPDPSRVFAALFVLGCVSGDETIGTARAIFDAAMRHPDESGAAVEALAVSPNPELAACVDRHLTDPRGHARAAAARVLAYRGELSEPWWHRLVRDADLHVVRAALAAPLSRFDPERCDDALRPLLEHGDEAIVRPALRAGQSLGLDSARASAADIVRSGTDWADAAACLARFGRLQDARLLRDFLERGSGLDGCGAAATLGSIDLVETLLQKLDRETDPREKARACASLTHITGLPFAHDRAREPSDRLWRDQAPRFQHGVRYRFGEPLGARLLLRCLREPMGRRGARADVYLELQVVAGAGLPRFDPFDFVGVQLEQLDRIDRWLDGAANEGALRRLH